MKSLLHHILSIFIIFTLVTISACSDGPAGPDTDDPDTEVPEATVHGSVAGNTSDQSAQTSSELANVEGATVTAAEVTSNGSFEAIAETETETDASGEFTIDVDVESAQHIAIVAETESEQWMGFLSKHAENDNTYTLKPIDTESSAETEIFSALVASGDIDHVQKADIEPVITRNNAAEVYSNSSVVAEFATGLTNAAQARAEFIAETTGDDADEIVNQYSQLAADAQFQLESELATATSAEQRESAYIVFLEAVTDAYVDAGLGVSSGAKVVEMWARTFVNSASSVSSEIKHEANASLYTMAAIAVDKAVRAEAEAAGMSESTIESIIDAGIQLKSNIEASGGVESEIETAFENYHEEVRTAMENDGSVEASVIVAIDSDINAAGGFKSVFESSISGTVSSGLIVETYNMFFSSVHSSAESHMETSDEAQVEAVAQIMILINLAS